MYSYLDGRLRDTASSHTSKSISDSEQRSSSPASDALEMQFYAERLRIVKTDELFSDWCADVVGQVARSLSAANSALATAATPAMFRSAAIIFDALEQSNRPIRHQHAEIERQRFRRARAAQLFAVVSEIAARVSAYYAVANGLPPHPPHGHDVAPDHDKRRQLDGAVRKLRDDPLFHHRLETALDGLVRTDPTDQQFLINAVRGMYPKEHASHSASNILEALEQGYDPTVHKQGIPDEAARVALLATVIEEIAARTVAYFAVQNDVPQQHSAAAQH